MASPPGTERPKLRAADVLSLNDSDLGRILRKIIPSGGNAITEIDGEGWAELSSPDQLRAVQRLRDWTQSAKSHPADLDQVTARLLEASASPAPLRQSQPSPTPSLEEVKRANYEELIGEETWSYNRLVALGGRPWYPFHLLAHVSKNRGEYHDMLRFWDPTGWLVYMRQLARWEKFCTWQRDNRGPLDIQADFEREWAQLSIEWVELGGDILKFETEERRKARFAGISRRRRWEHRYNVELGVAEQENAARFGAYALAMKARLGRHGFDRPFSLDQDLSRQDKVTTWIEYLNYEYWCHDQFVRKAEKLQPRYNEAMKAVQEPGVLYPGETLESINTYDYAFKLDHEKRVAKDAVKFAESSVSAAQKVLDATDTVLHSQEQGPASALEHAQARLNKAIETANAVEKRCELILNFAATKHPYETAKHDAEQHQKVLLQWILDQIPLIEAEIAETAPSDSSSRKRTREVDDEGALEQVSAKRRKQHNRTSREPDTQPVTRATRSKPMSDGGNQAKPGSEPPPKETSAQRIKAAPKRRQPRPKPGNSGPSSDSPPLRRSARIQALQTKRPATSSGQSTAPQETPQSTVKSSAPRKKSTGEKVLEKHEKPQRAQRKRKGRNS